MTWRWSSCLSLCK